MDAVKVSQTTLSRYREDFVDVTYFFPITLLSRLLTARTRQSSLRYQL